MEFNWKNFSHLFVGILVILSFFVFIGLPIISLFYPTIEMSTVDQIGDMQGSFSIIFEVLLLFIQMIMVIFLFVLVPLLWYRLINKYTINEIKKSIQLKFDHIDMAILWGLLTAIIALGMVFILGIILSFGGIADENASNIEDLELFFSIPSIFILITLQPIAEEIFFRGFLLDKCKITLGPIPAIIITSILFGLAHVSMGNIIPAVIIGLVALVFGFMAIKTKNLMTVIIAHIIFNVISFVLYLIGKELLMEGLIL